MGRLLDQVEDFFMTEGWKYGKMDDRNAVSLNMMGRGAAFEVVGIEDEQRETLTFYTVAPNRVPEDRRAEVAEFITRANYGLRNGNFEMDFGDGEVRYKTFIDVEGGEFSPKMAQNMFTSNFSTMDRYYPGLMKVVFGGATPRTAIAEIEGI